MLYVTPNRDLIYCTQKPENCDTYDNICDFDIKTHVSSVLKKEGMFALFLVFIMMLTPTL